MILKFQITFDTESGQYSADAETEQLSLVKDRKVNLVELSDKVSAMFIKLSKDYAKKILGQSGLFSKNTKDKIN